MAFKSKPTSYGLGSVIFDTKVSKKGHRRFDITPGQWEKSDGPATNIRWWDFLKAEEENRSKVGKKFEYRYDKNRKRIK